MSSLGRSGLAGELPGEAYGNVAARTWGGQLVDTTTAAPDHRDGRRGGAVGQWNESPHAQEFCAFGLSIVKPCASIRSAKSIVAPARYGDDIRSTTTSTPLKSA